MKVVMLTKNGCPQCEQLKMFLKFALNSKYDKDIEFVKKEENEALFSEYVASHEIKSTPALIAGDDVLRVFGPTQTTQFLEKHLGKR